MIQANRIFVLNNQTSSGRKTEEPVLDLLLSEFSISKYKKDILENYNTILFSGKFSTYTLSERYCAITYFTLKDLKQIVYLKEYCRFLGVSITRVNRLIKIINRHYSKSGIFDLEDLQPYYNKVDVNVDEVEQMVQSLPYTLTRGLASAIFYECSDLTQKETCKLFGISLPALKRNLKKVR
tara:strand:- start:1671 stop:2213 length:543 start_codon:yes stop_codon:yes gene_type:complete